MASTVPLASESNGEVRAPASGDNKGWWARRRRRTKFALIGATVLAALYVVGALAGPTEPSPVGGVPATTPHATIAGTNTLQPTPASVAATPTAAPTPKPLLTWDQLKARALRITYAELFRHNTKYVGRTVYYKGQVIQVLDADDGSFQVRANVTVEQYGFYKDTVFLIYRGERLLDDDVIDFVGLVDGLITYQSVLGGDITIPQLTVVRARILAHG